MDKNNGPYSLGIIALIMLTVITPAFAEVTNLQTNSESFYKGGQIKFSGIVEKDSVGLVTIVIRDLNDKFVMLTQALINTDNSFEKTIKIGNKFSEHGIYSATGFILNMTKGVTTDFGVSLNGVPINQNEEKINVETIKENTPLKENSVKETKIQNISTTTKIVDFVDSSKDPQHYIDRYYNEKSYKSWFDRNYPGLTIEEATGYTDNVEEIKSTVQELIDKEIIPEAQASSIVEPIHQSNNNSEIAQILLTIMGVGILFGAVYGVKRKVDDNSKQISINRETLRRRFIYPIIGSSPKEISINRETLRRRFIYPIIGSSPKEILKIRLAKGEITLEEYDKIKSKLY